MLLAFAYYVVFGAALCVLSAGYLWNRQKAKLACPTGVSRSICLVKRALDAMGRLMAGVVLAVAALIAMFSMIKLWDGATWPLAVLCVLGLMTGLSVSVQMRERSKSSGENAPWPLALGLTLGVPAVSIFAAL